MRYALLITGVPLLAAAATAAATSPQPPSSTDALPAAHLDHIPPPAMAWDGKRPTTSPNQTRAAAPPSTTSAQSPPTTPLRCYEVNRPPAIDPDALDLEACKVTLVERSFGNSSGQPSVIRYDPAELFPPDSACAEVGSWVHLTLRQDGMSSARQFDRVGSVQIQAVEVWRTNNPQPRRSNIVWTTTKDVNAYFDLFSKPGTLLFDYPNVVDNVYTGRLNITLSLIAYVPRPRHSRMVISVKQPAPLAETSPKVLPLSKGNVQANSFFILGGDNSSSTATAGDMGMTRVVVPRNAESALVEIYASSTAADNFWYTNVPDVVYEEAGAAAGPLTLEPRGAFREVQLSIDGRLAGIVQPYPVIYTGGIDPSNWRPSAAYGALVQPTYHIDVTPFLGELTDGHPHTMKLSVSSAESNHSIPASWFVSGNVQIALSKSEGRTTGHVTYHQPPAGNSFSTTYAIAGNLSDYKGVQISTSLEAHRELVVEGEVTTPDGKTRRVTWKQSAQFSSEINIKGLAMQNFSQSSRGTSASTHNGRPFLSTRFDFPLFTSISIDAGTSDLGVSKRNASVSHQYHHYRMLAEPRLSANTAKEQQTDVEQEAKARTSFSAGGSVILTSVGESLTSYRYQGRGGVGGGGVKGDGHGDGGGGGVEYTFARTNAFRNATVTRDEVSGNLAKYAPPVV